MIIDLTQNLFLEMKIGEQGGLLQTTTGVRDHHYNQHHPRPVMSIADRLQKKRIGVHVVLSPPLHPLQKSTTNTTTTIGPHLAFLHTTKMKFVRVDEATTPEKNTSILQPKCLLLH